MGPFRSGGATLITGASGYIGGLVTAALLAGEQRRVVLPLRASAEPARCRERLHRALLDVGVPAEDVGAVLRRVTVVELPVAAHFGDLDRVAAATGVDDVVHCAGCVDYFDEVRLAEANVQLTARLLRASRRWGVRRFTHLSTAYCAGYRTGVIAESLHPDPDPSAEPTAYTRSKRDAERLVADSGVPFLILRPSVVIGDSRTGHYTGKNYGLYQMWRATEGLLCREYTPIWHTIAPPSPVNLVHQDALQAALLGLRRSVGTDEIVHVVSDDTTSPTLHDLCWSWADVYRPVEIRSYPGIDQVPLADIPRRQRRFLEIGWKNFEIAAHRWTFDSSHLDRLRSAGIPFSDATLETVARCQRRYVEGSPRLQEHMRRYGGPGAAQARMTQWSTHTGLPTVTAC
jgi:nucleoside-diphosphate-sugar epimerase